MDVDRLLSFAYAEAARNTDQRDKSNNYVAAICLWAGLADRFHHVSLVLASIAKSGADYGSAGPIGVSGGLMVSRHGTSHPRQQIFWAAIPARWGYLQGSSHHSPCFSVRTREFPKKNVTKRLVVGT